MSDVKRSEDSRYDLGLLFTDGLPEMDDTAGYCGTVAARAAGISYRHRAPRPAEGLWRTADMLVSLRIAELDFVVGLSKEDKAFLALIHASLKPWAVRGAPRLWDVFISGIRAIAVGLKAGAIELAHVRRWHVWHATNRMLAKARVAKNVQRSTSTRLMTTRWLATINWACGSR